MPHTIRPVDKQQMNRTQHNHRKLHNSTTTSAIVKVFSVRPASSNLTFQLTGPDHKGFIWTRGLLSGSNTSLLPRRRYSNSGALHGPRPYPSRIFGGRFVTSKRQLPVRVANLFRKIKTHVFHLMYSPESQIVHEKVYMTPDVYQCVYFTTRPTKPIILPPLSGFASLGPHIMWSHISKQS